MNKIKENILFIISAISGIAGIILAIIYGYQESNPTYTYADISILERYAKIGLESSLIELEKAHLYMHSHKVIGIWAVVLIIAFFATLIIGILLELKKRHKI